MTQRTLPQRMRNRARTTILAVQGKALPIDGPSTWVSAEMAWAHEQDSPAFIRRRDITDWESMRRLFAFSLSRGSSCVDIGAHRGLVLEEILRVAPDGRHIAVEPIPALVQMLTDHFPTVAVHQLALSDRSGSSDFSHVTGDAEGWSGLKFRPLPADEDHEVEPLTVRIAPLDAILPDDFLPELIKVDVEGAELQVLRGAQETVRRHRPTIVFEHGSGSAEEYGTHPRDIYALLCLDAGYRLFDLDGNGPYSLTEFEHGFYSRLRVNWVARP